MSTGTLETPGPKALPPCLPAGPGRRRVRQPGPTALAVVHSFGLLALLSLGSLPHLLVSSVGGHLRSKRP